MAQSRVENSSVIKGIRLTLHKSVSPERRRPKKTDFMTWGSSDYLHVDVFHSLSELTLLTEDEDIGGGNSGFHSAEHRHLYIYKDHEINIHPNDGFDWIFRDLIDYPLIVVTLVNGNLSKISVKVEEEARAKSFQYDIFKTLGQGTGVIVFRSKTYTQPLSCIVALNDLSDHTYSIAGVYFPPFLYKHRRKPDSLLFSMLLEPSVPTIETPPAYANINYLLKVDGKSKGQVQNAIQTILSLRQKLLDDFNLSEQQLIVHIFYEIGRFDIYLKVEGHIAYILELFLNPKYGLANMESKFCRKYILESQTTWISEPQLGKSSGPQ